MMGKYTIHQGAHHKPEIDQDRYTIVDEYGGWTIVEPKQPMTREQVQADFPGYLIATREGA